MKNSIFEIPLIAETLNVKYLKTASAKSINLNIIRKLIKYSLNKTLLEAMLTLNVLQDSVITRPAGNRERNGYIFSGKPQKYLAIVFNYLKSDCLKCLEGFEWFFNWFSTTKVEKTQFLRLHKFHKF